MIVVRHRSTVLRGRLFDPAASKTTTDFNQSAIPSSSSSSSSSLSSYNMASTTDILEQKYPAKAHASKVVEYLQKTREKHGSDQRSKEEVKGVIYLEGQRTRMIEDCDQPQPFRYDST